MAYRSRPEEYPPRSARRSGLVCAGSADVADMRCRLRRPRIQRADLSAQHKLKATHKRYASRALSSGCGARPEAIELDFERGLALHRLGVEGRHRRQLGLHLDRGAVLRLALPLRLLRTLERRVQLRLQPLLLRRARGRVGRLPHGRRRAHGGRLELLYLRGLLVQRRLLAVYLLLQLGDQVVLLAQQRQRLERLILLAALPVVRARLGGEPRHLRLSALRARSLRARRRLGLDCHKRRRRRRRRRRGRHRDRSLRDGGQRRRGRVGRAAAPRGRGLLLRDVGEDGGHLGRNILHLERAVRRHLDASELLHVGGRRDLHRVPVLLLLRHAGRLPLCELRRRGALAARKHLHHGAHRAAALAVGVHPDRRLGLVLWKQLLVLRDGGRRPRVLPHARDVDPFVDVDGEQLRDEVLGVGGDVPPPLVRLEGEPPLDDLPQQRVHLLCAERHRLGEHHIE
mmetsp:Transcript_12857/g.37867  ORF Transcript_12857/g.37867 Transcript_12857/m.37867 type:complete len:456 (+) Transcript_12857:153-1520(+)